MKCTSSVAAGATLGAIVISLPANAQNFPAHSIRAVVGYAAGGGADGMIRAISNELSEALAQPVIIDNRPGGGTVIATKIVADAKPDEQGAANPRGSRAVFRHRFGSAARHA